MLPFRTNEIELNIQPKVITGSVSASSVSNYWIYPNGNDDKWWLLGSSPRGWQYEFTISINTQNHGSHLTRKPFEYNGMDVKVGDWMAFTGDGICLKIVSVSSKQEGTVTLIAEDYQRYNTFKSSSGNPISGGSDCIIFELQESGLPIIDPLPTGPGDKFQSNVGARFARQNIRDNFELYLANNSLTKGEVVSACGGNISATTCTPWPPSPAKRILIIFNFSLSEYFF